MPTSLSAKKRHRQSLKRYARNREMKSKVKTKTRRFTEAMENKDNDATYPRLIEAIRTIDKAASKGVIHKNKAARKKSYLTRLYSDYQNKLG